LQVVLRQLEQPFAQSLQPQDVHNKVDREQVMRPVQLKAAAAEVVVSSAAAEDIAILVHQTAVVEAVQVS
jgi:hypothetical protein